MGLFDSVVGALQGGLQRQTQGGGLQGQLLGALANSGNAGALLQVVTSLLGDNSGGLPGLVQKFQQSGLGNVVASWIASGHNLPISADQLGSVLGHDTIGQLAQTMGVTPDAAGGQLAQLLPQVVDALTPHGQLPAAGSELPLGQIATQVLGQFLSR
ncbi:MAG: YidB family protein [Leptothrix sp. (in: b-proteobacteria)]